MDEILGKLFNVKWNVKYRVVQANVRFDSSPWAAHGQDTGHIFLNQVNNPKRNRQVQF